MAALVDLSDEILLLVFEQLIVEGRPALDLKTLRLVCSRFRPLASSILFRRVSIQFPAFTGNPIEDELMPHSEGFLKFLLNDNQVRAQVQTIFIHGDFYNHKDEDTLTLKDTLVKLLPLLPCLKHVCIETIGANLCPSNPSEDSTLLNAIQQLERPVKLSLGTPHLLHGFTYTFNSHLLLDKVTCLEFLQVNLLNTPYFPGHGEPTYASFDGIPSQDIAKIIHQNPGLKDLYLNLNAENHAGQKHDLLLSEKEHALENIGRSMRSLRSLALYGRFRFTDLAWSLWDDRFVWANLHSLSLCTEPLLQEVTGHLIGKLPSLKSLSLEAPQGFSQLHPPSQHRYQTDVKSFLSSVTPSELSLLGLRPDNLPAALQNGSKLKRLFFHIRENLVIWIEPSPHMIKSPANFTDLLLMPKHLEDLQKASPSLKWLAIDCLPFHLNERHDAGQFPAPMAGFSKSTLQKLQDKLSSTSTFGPRAWSSMSAQKVLQIFNVPDGLADPIFTALTRFRSLSHLRLYIHSVPHLPWSFGIDDAARTFIWLQKHKQGVRLESLVICSEETEHREFNVPLILYDMGERKVSAERRGTTIFYDWSAHGEGPVLLTEKWRKVVATKEHPQDRWRKLDPDGLVMPIRMKS